jgi:recombination protein RecA
LHLDIFLKQAQDLYRRIKSEHNSRFASQPVLGCEFPDKFRRKRMSAFPVVELAASSRPFVFEVESLLKKLGDAPRLAQVTPASRLHARPAPAMAPTGIRALDALTDGWPRGCLSEICGPASSGRTGIFLAALAASTQNGEVCALVDAGDTLHPASAKAAGIEMKKLLWARCGSAVLSSQFPVLSSRGRQMDRRIVSELRSTVERWESRLEQVLKVTDLLLESNGFGMIVLDLGDVPARSARRIPLASWFRFRRIVERTPTVLLVVEQQPIAGSCSSVVIKVSGVRCQVAGTKLSAVSSQFSAGCPPHTELLDEFEITAELLRSRLERKPVQTVFTSFESKSAWAG